MSGVPKTVQFNMPMGKPNIKLKKTGLKGWGNRVITPLKGPEFPTTAKPVTTAPAAVTPQQKALEAPPTRLAITARPTPRAITAGPRPLALTGSRPMRQLEATARRAITAGPTRLALPAPAQKALPAPSTQLALPASPSRSNGAAWENRLSGQEDAYLKTRAAGLNPDRSNAVAWDAKLSAQEAAHLESRKANRGSQFPM
ncbi:hypothetical protein UFOVP223_70 [uncultured Caudovirales phage]|uniref:Uncharacterized protein n=1 Tax=uncultured Caudovirales phage TaxID=2100421 RepID=A0A6J7WTD0_9CAUD|nr:hypothetical protein UFOVP110_94 [uncultured Caudovirales phage]CAB5219404.1 hypothetical protein UFOVP223_70 [uncultured Caudovirales phage]